MTENRHTANRRSAAARVLQGDRGFTLATVALLGMALVMISAVIVLRAMASFSATDADRDWEQAIHVAEGGADSTLYTLNQQIDYDAYNTVPAGTDVSSRSAVIAAAGSLPVTATPEGEYAIVKVEGDRTIYSVGYTPSRDTIGHKARVVEMGFEPEIIVSAWSSDGAFLTGGDVDASNNAGTSDGTGNGKAHIHANGNATFGAGFGLDGCGSGFGNGTVEGINCPPVLEEIPIPEVVPSQVYYLSQFDLCPDGFIRSGPAHPVSPNATGLPCQGALTGLPGWSWTANKKTWKASDAGEGVVYVHHGNVEGKLGREGDATLAITLIVSSSDETGQCLSNDGHVNLNGGSSIKSHPDGANLAIVAGGDISMNGSAVVEGLTMAHEQIKFTGGTGSGGTAVAESACHHPASPVGPASIITGGTLITYGGPLLSPFQTRIDTGEIVVGERREL